MVITYLFRTNPEYKLRKGTRVWNSCPSGGEFLAMLKMDGLLTVVWKRDLNTGVTLDWDGIEFRGRMVLVALRAQF